MLERVGGDEHVPDPAEGFGEGGEAVGKPPEEVPHLLELLSRVTVHTGQSVLMIQDLQGKAERMRQIKQFCKWFGTSLLKIPAVVQNYL